MQPSTTQISNTLPKSSSPHVCPTESTILLEYFVPFTYAMEVSETESRPSNLFYIASLMTASKMPTDKTDTRPVSLLGLKIVCNRWQDISLVAKECRIFLKLSVSWTTFLKNKCFASNCIVQNWSKFLDKKRMIFKIIMLGALWSEILACRKHRVSVVDEVLDNSSTMSFRPSLFTLWNMVANQQWKKSKKRNFLFLRNLFILSEVC